MPGPYRLADDQLTSGQCSAANAVGGGAGAGGGGGGGGGSTSSSSDRLRVASFTERMQKYRLISKKGEGTFSEVLKAQSLQTGEYVAIKCMKNHFGSLEQVNNLREIQALKRLSPHDNIIRLIEVLFDQPTGRLALVFELMDKNVYEMIRGRRQYLTEDRIKWWMYQVVKAVDHMHKNGIFHRDIKPENILIMDDHIKVADFGSCRGIYSKQPFTEYISTRWYRAPECLLTDGYYNYKMDMWGIGCVFFEVVSLFPLFPGTNELDQISRVNTVLGTPSVEMLSKLKRSSHMSFNFPKKDGTGIEHLIPHVSGECMDLIRRLLAYNPDERISARQALKHPFFRALLEADKLSIARTPYKLPRTKAPETCASSGSDTSIVDAKPSASASASTSTSTSAANNDDAHHVHKHNSSNKTTLRRGGGGGKERSGSLPSIVTAQGDGSNHMSVSASVANNSALPAVRESGNGGGGCEGNNSRYPGESDSSSDLTSNRSTLQPLSSGSTAAVEVVDSQTQSLPPIGASTATRRKLPTISKPRQVKQNPSAQQPRESKKLLQTASSSSGSSTSMKAAATAASVSASASQHYHHHHQLKRNKRQHLPTKRKALMPESSDESFTGSIEGRVAHISEQKSVKEHRKCTLPYCPKSISESNTNTL